MAKQIQTIKNVGKQSFTRQPVKSSETLLVGAFVRMGDNGIEAINAASDDIGYICRGFVQPGVSGQVPLVNSPDTSKYTGTLTTTVGSESYAASATNTDSGGDGVEAILEEVLPGNIYRVQLDDTRGTTTGSDTKGYHLSTTTGIQLDESTAAGNATPLQCIIVNIPTEADVVDVKVRECQFAGVSA